MILNPSLSSFDFCPIEPFFAILHCPGDKVIEIPFKYRTLGEWGQPTYYRYSEPEDFPMLDSINLVYLSVREEKFYSLETKLNSELINSTLADIDRKYGESRLVIGAAPYGVVVLWAYAENVSVLLNKYNCDEASVPVNLMRIDKTVTLKDICEQHLTGLPANELNELISKPALEKRMAQYMLRYSISFEPHGALQKVNDGIARQVPQVVSICVTNFDGTFDKINNGSLLSYQFSGKPKKIALMWNLGKTEYAAYYWMDGERLSSTFSHFYGNHPDTKSDFIIRIDAEKKKYELALYRQGLKEPMVIPESVYQLIVFKNKFEDYRSENYNQPRGAWIW